jgi:3-methyladenine DNA glycosylase AlkD
VATSTLVKQLDGQLADLADPERATNEKRYLKSDMAHYGVRVPELHRIARKAGKGLNRPELLNTAEELWDLPSTPVFERRFLAADLLAARSDLLDADDADLLERMLRQSRTWALVDLIAPRVVGPLVDRDPDAWRSRLDAWRDDSDFWLRRASLLALSVPLRRGEGNFDWFAEYADALLEDKEFFVRKAIGWVLRDTARRRPDLIAAWVLPRAHRMNSVTIREAVKPLDAADRERILAAWKDPGA